MERGQSLIGRAKCFFTSSRATSRHQSTVEANEILDAIQFEPSLGHHPAQHIASELSLILSSMETAYTTENIYASADTTSDKDAPVETCTLFKFNPEQSVATLIKIGVLASYSHYNKNTTKSVNKIRHGIGSALLALTHVKAPPKAKKKRSRRNKSKKVIKFFSAQGQALREISGDKDTKFIIKSHPVKRPKMPVKDANQKCNEQFKEEVSEWIISSQELYPNPVIATVVKGICSILLAAEDSAGPFVEQFEKHIRLFKDLATVYALAETENLSTDKGCYGWGMAVDEGVKALTETLVDD